MKFMRNLGRFARVEVPRRALSDADAARDDARWTDAVRGYRAYLEAVPTDAAIWIQLGHALKELGHFDGALDAYERASRHASADPDAYLHRAHLLKRVGRSRDAEAAFLKLMRLAPTREIMDELTLLGLGERANEIAVTIPASPTRSTFIEVGDLLAHVEHHTTLTGISRVVLGLIHHILYDMNEETAVSYKFVLQGDAGERLFIVPSATMVRIAQAVMASVQDRVNLRSLLEGARHSAQPVSPGRGDVYLIPGAFWLACSDPSLFPRLRQDGVLIGIYLYDLIPVTHSRYCEASLTRTFAIALGETLPFLDFCLTISAYVARELQAFLVANGLPPIPTRPVPLAHEMRLGPGRRRNIAHHRVEDVLGRPFVLCVCTIETRKNHGYLLAVWHRMIEEGIDPPDLVLVGRMGWRAGELLAHAEACRHLDGRLQILQDVSDSDLTALYEACLFTAFPSFVEGWGLPVGESLSHGKICAASSTSSIPEVGEDFCVYFDPSSVASGFAAIGGLVTDPAKLAAKEASLISSFKPRTWTDLGRDFFSAIDVLVDQCGCDARTNFVPALRAGTLLTMERLFTVAMSRPDYVQNPQRLLFSTGWRRAEASGTWLAGPRARLSVRTSYAEGRDIVVTLHVGASPWVSPENLLQVWAMDGLSHGDYGDGEAHVAQPLTKNADFWIRVRGRIGKGGLATVHFKVDGSVRAEGDNLPVSMRLFAIGYAAVDDIASRMDILESRNLGAP